jgi:hypothetical protein
VQAPALRPNAREGAVPNHAHHVQSADDYISGQQDAGRGRLFRALVALAIIIAFAGILLATHYYVSHQRASTGTAQPSGDSTEEVGLEGVVKTDVRLRPDPGTGNRPLGIVTTGSRVRVISVKNGWYEIQVVQQGRDDPQAAERGWINKRFFDVN